MITVTRVEVSRLFQAQRGTIEELSVWMYASRVNPPSGMIRTGSAAASASDLKEVSTAHSTGTSQATASTARITKATTRKGSRGLRRRVETTASAVRAAARGEELMAGVAGVAVVMPSRSVGTRSPCRRSR